ncbi:MAG: DNA recombination/repair protein RecA, partial [Planctomycetes bacterium]|nr:DNA recombination/repair protein RecA [Planctomycetota bacterium]
RRVTTIKEGEVATGNHVKAKVVKNKVAAPFKSAEFDIMFNGGISTEGDLIDMAIADNVIERTGAWISYGQVRIGQGRENAKQFLRDNPDLADEIRRKILAIRLPSANGQSAATSTTSKPAKAAEKPAEPHDPARAKTPAPPVKVMAKARK